MASKSLRILHFGLTSELSFQTNSVTLLEMGRYDERRQTSEKFVHRREFSFKPKTVRPKRVLERVLLFDGFQPLTFQ